jgi:hypothetical protein
MNNINIILNEEEGTTSILYNGYNIIADTIYNKALTKRLVKLITEELKQNNYDFTTLAEYLKLK